MQLAQTSPCNASALTHPAGKPLGTILGSVTLPDHVVRESSKLADEFFTSAEESNFNDPVETYPVPLWVRRGDALWLPDLDALGYRRTDRDDHGRTRKELLVATASVDMHVDDEGLVLMVVLHNDGLKFKQGKVRHRPKAGDWFIFDDRKPHGVDDAEGRATFVGWNIPITLA